MDTKEAQKRTFLAKWVRLAEFNLDKGINALRYWCASEADSCEAQLSSFHRTLVEMTGDGRAIKEAITGVDEVIDYMMYVWTENLCGLQKWQVDTQFAPAIDVSQMDYAKKFEKALAAKQMHAPGFDGQGGGAARGSTTE